MSANFSYGVIAAVGVLVAASLGFVVMDPDEIVAERTPMSIAVPGLLPVDEAAVVEAPPVDEAAVVEAPPPVVSMPPGTSTPECKADNTCYLPYNLEVAAGTAVTWINDDTAAHTVTSGTVDGLTGLFDSGLVMSGAAFEYVFEEAGTYDYYCIVHPWMTGIVTVS